jgi:hypothetical protein
MRQFLKINISSPVSMICELSEVSLAADSERRVSSCSMPVRVDTCGQIKRTVKRRHSKLVFAGHSSGKK